MSTNGFLGFRISGVVKGTYNHSDSYPDGLGSDVVDFIRQMVKDDRLIELKDKLAMVEMVTAGSTPTKEQIEMYAKFADAGVDNGKLSNWYVLLREPQGIETFKCIIEDKLHHIIDNTLFMTDTAMCEYGYVLNFDAMSIEFYDMGECIGDMSFESIAENEKYAGNLWIKEMYPGE